MNRMSAPLTSMPSGTHLLPRLYAHAAGPLSATYYRDLFERMEAQGRPLPAWNHAAAFNTLAWLCLRRMWLAAGIYAAAMALLLVLVWAVVAPLLGTTTAWMCSAALLTASVLLPGLWGNQLYYQHLRARTLQALQASDTLVQAQQQLGALAVTEQRRNTTLATQAALLILLASAALSFVPTQPAAPATPAPSGPPVLHFPSTPAVPTAPPAPAEPALPITPSTPVVTPAAPSTPTAHTAPPKPTNPATAAAPINPALAATAATTTAVPPPPVRAAKTAAPAASTNLVPGRFYLNAGVFSQVSNADKAEQALRQAGLPVLRTKVQSAKGEVVRLRSGPFETASQARAAQRTAAQQQLDATVFQHRNRS